MFFSDSVLPQSDSAEFGVRFGHYRPDVSLGRHASKLPLAQLPEEGQGAAREPTRNLIPDMSVRAGRVYNSEASVRAGLQYKTNVEDPSVRLRGSNLEGSVHMKAYDVDITPDSSTNEDKLLKTTTVHRGGKDKPN